MNFSSTEYFTLTVLVMFLGQWFFRHRIQPFFIRKQLRIQLNTSQQAVVAVVDALYRGLNSRKISLQAQRDYLGTTPESFIYGEIEVLSFLQILAIANPKPQSVFYDLGCGTGKAVFVAALVYDCQKVCGVELLPPLQRQCVRQVERLKNLKAFKKYFADKTLNIEFLLADLLAVDISDADIVFINATAFKGALWERISKHLQQNLRVGSRVILTSHQLTPAYFKAIYAGKQLMSWGLNSLYIYERS